MGCGRGDSLNVLILPSHVYGLILIGLSEEGEEDEEEFFLGGGGERKSLALQ